MENGFSVSGKFAALAFSLVVGSLAMPVQASVRVQQTAQHVSGEFIVKLKRQGGGFSTQAVSVLTTLRKKLGQNGVLAITPFMTDKAMHKVRLARDKDLAVALEALGNEPSVEYAEPNFVFHAFGDRTPNDADFGKLWGMNNTGQTDAAGQVGKVGSDINVLPLWNEGYTGSRKVVVAVIDTGIDWDHPDLKDNLWTNSGEAGDKASNSKDDDGNGFVDDIHGYNFAAHTANSRDDHNHGTHCAGTIGGVGNNGLGVAGVNWEVTLMPVKFLDAGGSGSLEGAVESINYARMMKVHIMSNSWGGGGYTKSLEDAIKAANEAGIIFVAAAGNDTNDNDANASYPASYNVPNIISVAALDNQDKLATFSNWGKTKVHVGAPGVKVYSTVKDGKYNTFSGTSMATPHVAGISALMLSVDSSLKATEVKDRLVAGSVPVRALQRKILSGGRVNAYNAVRGLTAPALPQPDPALWVAVPKVTESEHPYKDNQNYTFTITHPGAKFIRVHFEKIDVERGYDKVFVQDVRGDSIETLTGSMTDYMTDYVEGESVTVRLKTDYSGTGYGFKIDKIEVIQKDGGN